MVEACILLSAALVRSITDSFKDLVTVTLHKPKEDVLVEDQLQPSRLGNSFPKEGNPQTKQLNN